MEGTSTASGKPYTPVSSSAFWGIIRGPPEPVLRRAAQMRGRRRQSFGNLHGEPRTIPDIGQKQLAQVCGRPRLQLTPLMHLHSTYCLLAFLSTCVSTLRPG